MELYKVSNCVDLSPKKLNARNAKYVIDHLDFGIKYCNANKKVGLVTGPIQKSTLLMLDINLVDIPNGSKKRLAVQTF